MKGNKPLATMMLAARKGAGLTQRELAEKIGSDPTYISHLEAGRRSPSLDMLKAIASACHHTLSITLEAK